MVEYSKINCKLTNVQLNKLKKVVKSNEGTTLRLGIKNFNKDETPHELLLTTRQNIKLHNAINNNSAIDIKLSKAQIKKLIQSGGFLGKLLSKLAGPLLKVAMPLAKNVLAPLGLTAAMSAIDGSIQKKIHGSGVKLIIEEEDMQVREVKKKLNSLLPFHPLTNIEISKYYSNEPKFNGVYSRDNLPKITKKGAYVINLDEYENAGTRWIALFIKTNEVIYFDSFGIEHIPKEINIFIRSKELGSGVGNNKKIKANIFRIQAFDSIMCGYFCIEFINYMLKGKTLLDYTNLFSPNDFKMNDRVIKRIFKNEYGKYV